MTTTYIAQQQPATTLPGEPVPYVLEAGSGRAHVLLGQVGRALIGAEESSGTMSFLSLDSPRVPRPIPLHVHDREHEFFYCVRGRIQVWAGEESRVLTPGDFAVVPPGTQHAYQTHDHFSTFVGPVVPGGWDRFFDLTGEPFDGPAFPTGPVGPPPFEKFGRAEAEFGMKYHPELPYGPASEGADNRLPGRAQPYFLRNGEGARHELAGQLQTTLLTGAETDGLCTMTVVTMPKGPGLPLHAHGHTHEALLVLEGRLRLTLDGTEHELTRGDLASIPAGTQHAYQGASHYTKVLTSSAPGGLEGWIAAAGTPTEARLFGATQVPLDHDALRAAAAEVDVVLA